MEDRQTVVQGKPLYRLKMVFVGDSGVGKSSIINKFTKDQFNLLTVKTIGIQFSSRQCQAIVKGRLSKIIVQCWDTMGQQKYQSVSNMFYKNAVGVIFVYDITKRQSFQNLEKWYKQVMQRSNEFAVLMLLGNKNDLKYLRTVKPQQGRNWAQQKSIMFIQTSALNGSNLQIAMVSILQQVIHKVDEQQIRTRDTVIIQQSNTTKEIVHHSCC